MQGHLQVNGVMDWVNIVKQSVIEVSSAKSPDTYVSELVSGKTKTELERLSPRSPSHLSKTWTHTFALWHIDTLDTLNPQHFSLEAHHHKGWRGKKLICFSLSEWFSSCISPFCNHHCFAKNKQTNSSWRNGFAYKNIAEIEPKSTIYQIKSYKEKGSIVVRKVPASARTVS